MGVAKPQRRERQKTRSAENRLGAGRCGFGALLNSAQSRFTPDFSSWISERYGPEVRNQIERLDLGPGGSYGGKQNRDENLTNQPVVFVHGVSDTAGEKPTEAANWFRQNGYSANELYSTTYFNGAQGNPLKWVEYSMRCEYIKQVRSLLVSVRLYTGTNIDVVAYSLGVVVARKAILGGRCVDTGEYLGSPLTRIVDTFVGVAGPNHGISPQVGGVGLPACALAIAPICNQVNGLYSGMCPNESEFLQDINRFSHYEGQYVYSIYSTKDQVVGQSVCNQVTSRIPGQTGERVFDQFNHDQTFDNTHGVQLSMIRDHVIV
ncbi:unnamed protein product [Caenorhabditis auriculariae]|uniref:Uncharacterized protein n=1 Tax=Caenorhabditis auriculariae TaxID=2777116 RepID=A0A8S1I0E3_9PELO|nr:unnamed protein product [Caenorhabditis auriculariae]